MNNKILTSLFLLALAIMIATPFLDVFSESELKMKEVDMNKIVQKYGVDENEVTDFKIIQDTNEVKCTADNGESQICKYGCLATKDSVQCIQAD
ncbi:MAG: hypothetical protein ACPKPY_00785 [Nitrososphaeraceae archaeon]